MPWAPGADVRRLAKDCVAMVDGFATPGTRHWKARLARSRQERALARTVEDVWSHGTVVLEYGNRPTALEAVAAHTDADGSLLDLHTAAVELLNVLRSTAATTWFATFAAPALHRFPVVREELRNGDGAYARAFAHEVRRGYLFAPFVGGLAARDLRFDAPKLPEGTRVLLDVSGHHRDPELWPEPQRFEPRRFLGREPDAGAPIAQGGANAHTGHRCPGDDVTTHILATLARELADLELDMPCRTCASLRRDARGFCPRNGRTPGNRRGEGHQAAAPPPPYWSPASPSWAGGPQWPLRRGTHDCSQESRLISWSPPRLQRSGPHQGCGARTRMMCPRGRGASPRPPGE
ncbi:cytochrome P450 [Streptomyces sp. NPDC015661]|uniref:cytochrome P450 n=1 Tax=Streptomyces sp. NPDC015661 TaxID=3364961 RepID=UPI00370313F0